MKYMSAAGATPKLTTSTSPKRVPLLLIRASNPSSISRTPAITMYQPAR